MQQGQKNSKTITNIITKQNQQPIRNIRVEESWEE